jgi:hypothetical protein
MRVALVGLLLVLTAACSQRDEPQQITQFCSTLAAVNQGAVDTSGLAELSGHAAVVEHLLANAPPSLHPDLQRIHDTVDAWARAVDGQHPMRDTFDLLSDPELIGAEGRVTEFAAAHCGVDLGGPQWVQGERPTVQDVCPAWPRIGTPLTFNHFPNLPDIAGSNYFSNMFLVSKWGARLGLESLKGAFIVEPGGRVEFRHRYPATRYFAYHPNDMDLNNLPTLRDRDLQPDPGSVNPFVEPAPAGGDNYYTANLVFGPEPEQPAANTSYVGVRKDGVTENPFVMNLLRMYHVDAGNGPGSGGVPLPAMTIYDAAGEVVRHYPECDLFAPGVPEFSTDSVYPAMPVMDHRAVNPPVWSNSSNFNAPSDTLANADVQYLSVFYSERFGDLLVVRAKYLTAPDTRNGQSPSTDTQVRLYNLCTYNFWNGGATQCMLENELARDEAGYYTLIVAPQDRLPSNMAAEHATWIDWGPYLDGQLTYRFVYRENPYAQALTQALAGEEVDTQWREYVPQAVHCDREVFETGGWEACLQAQP